MWSSLVTVFTFPSHLFVFSSPFQWLCFQVHVVLVASCPLAHEHVTDWGIRLCFNERRGISCSLWGCDCVPVGFQWLTFFSTYRTVYLNAQAEMCRMHVCKSVCIGSLLFIYFLYCKKSCSFQKPICPTLSSKCCLNTASVGFMLQ